MEPRDHEKNLYETLRFPTKKKALEYFEKQIDCVRWYQLPGTKYYEFVYPKALLSLEDNCPF